MRVDLSLVSVLLLTGVLWGCGKAPEARFELNQPTKGLVPKARKAVEKSLVENFGTPEHLVAWQKFPIDYGTPEVKTEGEGHAVVASTDAGSHGSESKSDPGMGHALIPMRLKVDKSQPGWKLQEGRNLYMRHCLHCHGVSGDGDGPTAQYLNPRPRDYRQGVFKFTSTL